MGKSTNGPDWTDVLMTIRAIEVTHECRVEVVITTASNGHNGGGRVEVRAVFDTLPGSASAARVWVEFHWPSGRGLGLVGSVYRALLELDYKISHEYRQGDLIVP